MQWVCFSIWSSDVLSIYTTFIWPKMCYNFHVWARPSKSILRFLDGILESAKVGINGGRAYNSIDSLEHRLHIVCVYCNGLYSGELKNLVPENIHLWSTGQNLVFSLVWNALPARVFSATYDINSKIHRHYLLVPPSSNPFL